MASWSQLGLEANVTTLALRGIAKTHNRGSILRLLDYATAATSNVPVKKYNFVYMPVGRSTHAGLAIVNFVDAEACHRCFLALKQMQEQGLMVGIKSIGQSKIQGFAENLAYYVVVSQQDGRVTDEPLIFVDGQVADQRMLNYLIKHCVTNAMKQRAEEQAEALYSTRKMGPSPYGLTPSPLQPGCLSRKDSTEPQGEGGQVMQAPKFSSPGQPVQPVQPRLSNDIRALCDRLGCKTCDGMVIFSL